MYQRLLLNCEGGIIDAAQQAEQENCAVICIGLGGTGIDCLKNLKAKIYNRIRPDDSAASVPTYSHIKFLAVDSDKYNILRDNERSAGIGNIDLYTEFLDISCAGDISGPFGMRGSVLEERDEYKEWLRYNDISAGFARDGAGGVRQMGRYLFMEHAHDFTARLNTLIRQATAGLSNPQTYVHIFSGLCGGTGGGSFLDVSYLAREVLMRNRTEGYVSGYFFLPDVNLPVAPSGAVSAQLRVNGYASLQELDYCMNFENNGDKWSQSYFGIGKVESDREPVDLCYLISARDAGGVIGDAYKYALNVVSEHLMDFIVKRPECFTMPAYLSGTGAAMHKLQKEHGAQYGYCILGASTARLPYKEILTYLTSKIFERISDLKKAVSSKVELECFVAKNGLKYDAILAKLTRKCDMTFPLPDVKWREAKDNDNLTVTYFEDLRARLENSLEINYSSLAGDLEDFTSEAGGSLIAEINKALRAVAADPDRGPFFAAALLRSTAGGDLITVIDGYIRETRAKFAQENIQEDRLRPAWEQAQRDFFENANALNGAKKYDVYRNAIRNLEIHYSRLAVLGKMDNLMTKLRGQLIDLARKFMDVFKNTVSGLVDTFDENMTYLDLQHNWPTPCEFPLVEFGGIKGDLDRTIEEMDVKAKIAGFFNMMLSKEGIDSWIVGDENRICMIVNKYFADLFSAYSHKTITDYLLDKCGAAGPVMLVYNIKNDIMNRLDADSAPMFWTSHAYNTSGALKMSLLTFPADSCEIEQAAREFSLSKAPGEITVRAGSLQDRISIIRCFAGVPMYGYGGILQFENDSVSSAWSGKHLYEGKMYTDDSGEEVSGRDWRHLPSPIPYSLMSNRNSEILKESADEAKTLYEEAEAKGIIAPVEYNNYGIRIISAEFMDKIRKVKDEFFGKIEAERSEGVEKISSLMSNIEYDADVAYIPNDADAGLPEPHRRMIRIDHFVSAPKIQEIAKAEIKKYSEIDRILAELQG